MDIFAARFSSDGGLLLYRELDEVLGLTERAEEVLEDARTGKNTQHTLTGLLRQSVYGRLAGYKVVRHSKFVTFQLAEVAVPRELFAAILERIDSLRWSPGAG